MNEHIQSLHTQIAALEKELLKAQRDADIEPVADYTLRTPDDTPIHLHELFGNHDDLLIIHNMGKGCRYCTLWADGFVSAYPSLKTRCAFVLCSADKPSTLKAFAQQRKWNYPVVSGADCPFAREMGFASDKNEPWPGVSAFHREPDGTIMRTGCANFGPGDKFCSVWPLMALLRDGANGWEPEAYD